MSATPPTRRGSGRGLGWGGKKVGFTNRAVLRRQRCCHLSLCRFFRSQRCYHLPLARSDAVAAGWGGRNHGPTAKASPTLSESGERQRSFVFLSY